ncbi:MAG: tripartite tricarboxylate transporter substrate binding protein [Betaproteobacteria bacterium]|nr:tripartite tricarboxylate transporter substrate binding protein [Betaproteobacteria bacterium]MBI3936953.1 tripartite tricarboxylate transporter substrate binding protein [Betaproteobacteria bacterium]
MPVSPLGNPAWTRHLGALSAPVLLALLCLASPLAGRAAAQPDAGAAYPARPLRIIVPYAAGGGGDILARMIGAKLTEAWGQPVVVDNRPGGGTIIGTDLAAKASPDGYTILLGTNTHAVNETLYRKLPYRLMRDLAPVTQLATAPNILIVNPSVPARTLRELIALAKAKPRQVNYGSSGNGGTGHLAMELLKTMAGIDLVHVPYKGGGPALNALLAGEVSALFNNIIAAVPQVQAGRVRPLGVTSSRRSAALPEVPTIAESGVPGFEAIAWFGLFAPAGTPRAIVAKLSREVARVLKLPDIHDRLSSQGAEPVGSSADEFSAVIRSDIAKWGKVVKAARVVAD